MWWTSRSSAGAVLRTLPKARQHETVYWPSMTVFPPPLEPDAGSAESGESAAPASTARFDILEVEVLERLEEPPPNLRAGFHCEVIEDSRLPSDLSPPINGEP